MLWESIPLERNRMALVELKGVSKRLRPPRILTERSLGLFSISLFIPIAVCPPRCCTGLRVSEVMVCDGRNQLRKLGDRNQRRVSRSQVTKLKSECSRDELPLDPGVATILLEWKRLCLATEGDWVFPSPRTAKPYDSGSLRKKVLHAAALRAKIQDGSAGIRFVTAIVLGSTKRVLLSVYSRNSCAMPTSQHDERLWRSLHGIEAQSQHFRRAARVGSRSHKIAKGRLVTASAVAVQTLLDHFRPQSKNPIPRNL